MSIHPEDVIKMKDELNGLRFVISGEQAYPLRGNETFAELLEMNIDSLYDTPEPTSDKIATIVELLDLKTNFETLCGLFTDNKGSACR